MMGAISGTAAFVRESNVDVFINGCICHRLHLTAEKGAKQLSFSPEELLVSIYYYLEKSSKRHKEFKQVQAMCNVADHAILKHICTRWVFFFIVKMFPMPKIHLTLSHGHFCARNFLYQHDDFVWTYFKFIKFKNLTHWVFLRGNKSLFNHQIGNINFFIFITIQWNLMFCVDNIKYEHLAILSKLKSCQFAPRIVILNLCIYCQFKDLQLILLLNNSCKPSQHLTVTNEGSYFAVYFSFSFGT